MRWERFRRSSNVSDRRGQGAGGGGRMPGGGKGLGLTGIVIVLLLAWATGKNPLELLALLDGGAQAPSQSASTSARAPDPNDPAVAFV